MGTLTPSRFGSFQDDASFQMPIPGLFGDVEAGDASIGMTDEFLELSAHTRVRMVSQWMREFRTLHDMAIVEMFRLHREGCDGSIVDQLESFRQLCRDDGITVPAELPLLLQRY